MGNPLQHDFHGYIKSSADFSPIFQPLWQAESTSTYFNNHCFPLEKLDLAEIENSLYNLKLAELRAISAILEAIRLRPDTQVLIRVPTSG
jgi:hypothetical protein